MSQMVWFVLKDGQSMIACCNGVSAERLELALTEPQRVVTLTDDAEATKSVPASDIRDFLVFESAVRFPPHVSVYHVAGVA